MDYDLRCGMRVGTATANNPIAFLIEIDGDRAPDTLERWCWQCILASFEPTMAISEVWGATLEYIGWLNSLPVTN